MNSAEGKFLDDYPEQAGKYRETHMPLSNYEVDRKNAEISNDATVTSTLFDDLFAKVTVWVKLFTVMLISFIGLGLVSSVLFGIDGGFGIVTNISELLSSIDGLTGLIILFLVYYLFIRSGEKEET